MRKITNILIACLLLASLNSFAGNGKLRPGTNNQSNSFTSFYSEDFNGSIQNGWVVIDNAGNGLEWKHTFTGAGDGSYLEPTGTSAANGYVIIDSDSAGGVGGENSDLISGLIDCTGKSSVHLVFNQYLYYYNDTSTVLISNDGSNWTEVYNSSDGLSQFDETTNPELVDIDITSLAANQDTVYIRFNYRADYSFYWMIDDVQLYELPTDDAAATELIGPATSCIPLSATEGVTLNIFNAGSADITAGLTATYVLDGGTPVTENVTTPITVGNSFAYTFTATADLTAPGIHSVMAWVSLTGDSNATNDTVHAMIFNGPHIVDGLNNYSNGFEGNEDVSGFLTEDVNNDNISWEITSLLPYAGNMCAAITAAQADDWLFTTCVDLDAGLNYNLQYYYRTTSTSTQADYEILLGNSQASGDMTQQLVTLTRITNVSYLPGNAPFSVPSSGTYFIGFHVYNGDSIASMRLDNINLTTTGVGVQEISGPVFEVFPNPASGSIMISSRENSTSGFSVEVVNPVGQVIKRIHEDALYRTEIDLSDVSEGMYFIRVISEKGSSARPVTVSR